MGSSRQASVLLTAGSGIRRSRGAFFVTKVYYSLHAELDISSTHFLLSDFTGLPSWNRTNDPQLRRLIKQSRIYASLRLILVPQTTTKACKFVGHASLWAWLCGTVSGVRPPPTGLRRSTGQLQVLMRTSPRLRSQ